MRRDGGEVPVDHVGGNLRCERGGLMVEEGRRGVADEESIGLQDGDEGLAIGDEAVDPAGTQPAREHRRCSRTIGRVCDDLGEHRVVVRRHHRSGLHAGVHAQPHRSREALERAGVGQVSARGILCIQAHLDRVTAGSDLFLSARQILASSHPDLPFDKVQAGDHLSDGMLHLETGIHLEEVELLRVALARHDELDRAGADIADALRQRHGSGVHRLSEVSGKTR